MSVHKDNECKPQWKVVPYVFIFRGLHIHLHHYYGVPLCHFYTLCSALAGPDASELQGGEGEESGSLALGLMVLTGSQDVCGLCPNTFPHCHLGLFQSEMTRLFFSPMTLLGSVGSLVGRTALFSAGGCWHHAGQGVSPTCFGDSWSSSAWRDWLK